jgi:hypothetical protein
MSVIWKFPIPYPSDGTAEVRVPEGTRILSAGVDQLGTMFLWGIVPEPPPQLVSLTVIAVNTGESRDDIRGEFVGRVAVPTTFDLVPEIVWHIFVEQQDQ